LIGGRLFPVIASIPFPVKGNFKNDHTDALFAVAVMTNINSANLWTADLREIENLAEQPGLRTVASTRLLDYFCTLIRADLKLRTRHSDRSVYGTGYKNLGCHSGIPHTRQCKLHMGSGQMHCLRNRKKYRRQQKM